MHVSSRRIVKTSCGWLVIDLFNMRGLGFMVTVERFAEDGWDAAEKEHWYAQRSDESLAQFLSSYGQLPELEASELAVHVQGQWREAWLAGGATEEKAKLEHFALKSIIVLVVVALLALMGAALLIWLVVS